MHQGWIKVHRTLLEKPIWTEATPEQKVILMALLLLANHGEKQWEWKGKRFTAQPGQFVTSLPSLVQKCGKSMSIQKVRTALKRFERYEFLTDESTPQNRLITIVNWGIYQGLNEDTTEASTDSQQMGNRQVTANKNVKNEKNEKKSNHRNSIYEESSEFYQSAFALFQNVKRNHPGIIEPNLQQWSDEMRLIVERDKRTIEQISRLISWSGQHPFWHTVVLTPVSLRRNWDRMVLQLKQEHAMRKGQIQHIRKKPVDEFRLDLSKGEEA